MSGGGHGRIEVAPGVELFVQDVGSGRPVVLIAGFGMSHEAWDAEVRLLAEAGHRVVCVDLRGTGLSDKPLDGYEVERLADDVEAVIERLDLRQATLVGWSFGGQVAFRLAASIPERLAQLVLVASNGVRASRSEEFPFGRPPDQLEEPLLAAERADRVAARRQTIASGFHREPDAHTLDWLVACSLRMPSWAAVASYRSMFRSDLLADLPRVELPALLIFGEEDPVHSGKAARWLSERLPGSRMVELRNCGHFPMFEAPQEFDAALLEFIAEVPDAPD